MMTRQLANAAALALSLTACAGAPEPVRGERSEDGGGLGAERGAGGEDATPDRRVHIEPAGEALPDWGDLTSPWERWHLERDDAPALEVFVARDETPRPLVVLLQGSGCVPLFFETPGGAGASLLFWREVAGGDHPVHFAAVEKRGVASFGPPPQGQPGTMEGCSQAYVEGAVKPERVADVVDVVSALGDEPWVDGVLVAGHSEGAAVASGVAEVLGERLVAVGLFSAAGPSQLVDFVVYAHRSGEADRVRDTFDDILTLTDPQAEGAWRGHDISRWQTFAVDTSPLEELRGKSVPVFVVHGSADESSPVESADAFVVELLREGPERPVFYLRLQEVGHGLIARGDENLRSLVLRRFISWALSESNARGVEVWP
jgi:pimeloyl-ACP methyl ester carboxylesterase